MYTQFQVTAKMFVINPDTLLQSFKRERFIFEADCFSSAECRALEWLGKHHSGGYGSDQHYIEDIVKIEGTTYVEFYDYPAQFGTDPIFCVQIAETECDAVSNKEKEVKHKYLIRATDIDDARESFKKHYTMLATTRIVSITETQIIEFFPRNLAMADPMDVTVKLNEKEKAARKKEDKQ